jgi:hypothetical protein
MDCQGKAEETSRLSATKEWIFPAGVFLPWGVKEVQVTMIHQIFVRGQGTVEQKWQNANNCPLKIFLFLKDSYKG